MTRLTATRQSRDAILPVVDPCPFCSVPSKHILVETEHALALPDGFPVSQGHTLVVPRLHAASLYDLPPAVQAAMWKMVEQIRSRLLAELKPHGFNIGLNDGTAAGQTVMHAHVHVIPRWAGDVPDPRGGVRWVVPEKAAYWRKS